MAYSPMQDAVTEVRVQAFDMDASSGHTMGGTVNVVTKSGTNSLHGSAYIYNQTSAVDAPTCHFSIIEAASRGRLITRINMALRARRPRGWVPKVFNGKNKVFWFFGWEGMRDSDPADSPAETGSPEDYTSVPTAAERQGNFSQFLGLASNSVTIYDPNSGVLSGTLVSRTPFPGNVIPTNRLNPVALSVPQLLPRNNNNTTFANGNQNYTDRRHR